MERKAENEMERGKIEGTKIECQRKTFRDSKCDIQGTMTNGEEQVRNGHAMSIIRDSKFISQMSESGESLSLPVSLFTLLHGESLEMPISQERLDISTWRGRCSCVSSEKDGSDKQKTRFLGE